MHLPPSILSSFVTLLVTIGPVETAVIFASLTAEIHRGERRTIAVRSTAMVFRRRPDAHEARIARFTSGSNMG